MKKLSPWFFITVAALGQFFLSNRLEPFSVVPAILLFSLAVWGLQRTLRTDVTEPVISLPVEVLSLVFILSVASLFRFYHLDSFPCGVSVDQSIPGLGGLKVLGGWRPFFENDLLEFPIFLFYPMALWFKFFTPTQYHLALYTVLFAFLTFGPIYWTIRQLAGTGPALLTSAFWAISHWDAYLSRWAAMHLVALPFVYGALAFWFYGLSRKARWPFVMSGIFLGCGLYSYYSFRIFPFIMAGLVLWEAYRDKENFRSNARKWVWLLVAFLLTVAPLSIHWSQKANYGQGYPSQQFIGAQIVQEKSLMPLVRNIGSFLGMFGRAGDPSPKQTSDQAPMLDPVTDLLAVLGFGLFFWRVKERFAFYPLLLFVGFSLNNILCNDPTNVSHVYPLLPVVLFFAAYALWRLWLHSNTRPFLKTLLVLVVVGAAGVLNWHQLFEVQAKDPSAGTVFDLGPTLAGQEVVRLAPDYDIKLCPSFGPHCTVQFLAYRQAKDYYEWSWPGDLAFATARPGKKGICFLMTRGERGIVDLLKRLYPKARVEILNDGVGLPLIYEVKIDREELSSTKGLRLSGAKGRAVFFVPTSDSYRFLTNGGPVGWKIDGKKLKKDEAVHLSRGFHSLEIHLKTTELPVLRFEGKTSGLHELNSDSMTQLPLNHGLLATYWKNNDEKQGAAFTEWDPMVNVVSHSDLSFFGSDRVDWNGRIWIEKTGRYSLLALTEPTDRAALAIDGKPLGILGPSPQGELILKRGWHDLHLKFQVGDDYHSVISLAWKKDGEAKYSPIPMEAFGLVEDR